MFWHSEGPDHRWEDDSTLLGLSSWQVCTICFHVLTLIELPYTHTCARGDRHVTRHVTRCAPAAVALPFGHHSTLDHLSYWQGARDKQNTHTVRLNKLPSSCGVLDSPWSHWRIQIPVSIRIWEGNRRIPYWLCYFPLTCLVTILEALALSLP